MEALAYTDCKTILPQPDNIEISIISTEQFNRYQAIQWHEQSDATSHINTSLKIKTKHFDAFHSVETLI